MSLLMCSSQWKGIWWMVKRCFCSLSCVGGRIWRLHLQVLGRGGHATRTSNLSCHQKFNSTWACTYSKVLLHHHRLNSNWSHRELIGTMAMTSSSIHLVPMLNADTSTSRHFWLAKIQLLIHPAKRSFQTGKYGPWSSGWTQSDHHLFFLVGVFSSMKWQCNLRADTRIKGG